MALKTPQRATRAAIGALTAAAAWLAAANLGLTEIAGINDASWLWAAVVLGLLAGALDLAAWLAGIATILVALLLAVSWIPALGALSRRYVRTDSLPSGPADALMVLSGGVSDDGRLNGAAVDRLLEGIRLVKAGAARHLVLSRVVATPGRDTVTSDRDQRWIVGVTGLETDLRIVDPVGSTRLEAVRMAELAKAEGWHRIILVTSPVHTRRACATFEAVGLAVVCRPSPDRLVSLRRLASPRDRVTAFGQWLYETLGWWKYRLRGWVGSGTLPAPRNAA